MALPGPLVLSSAPAPLFNAGRHLINGDALNVLSAMVGSSDPAITATAGGGRATAYGIKATMNQVTVVASAGDSVVLPKSFAGMSCVILNNGANALQVFANGTDTIKAISGAVGVSQAAATCFDYICVAAGNWQLVTFS